MRITFILLVILFCSSIIWGQSTEDSNNKFKSRAIISPTELKISLPDTVQFKGIPYKKESQPFIENAMPWITALLIGIFSALVNFWIAFQLRQSNERNLERQIKNTRETTITQINATIGTKNRQEWITELRNTLSDYLACAARMTPDAKNSPEDRNRYIDKIFYSKFKIELLINPDKQEQKELLDSVNNLLDVISKKIDEFKTEEFIASRHICADAAQKLFGLHWNKIKGVK